MVFHRCRVVQIHGHNTPVATYDLLTTNAPETAHHSSAIIGLEG
jgi:hypothetical protein